MTGFSGVLVDAPFRAAFALFSHTWDRHRVSLRLDTFRVRDGDKTPDDPNREVGHAWTASYFLDWPSGERRGRWRLGLELLTVSSDRPARRLFDQRAAQDETSLALVAQWRFDHPPGG